MLCDDCIKETDVVFTIKIVIEKDYLQIKTISETQFCLNCFKKTNEGRYFDQRIDL